MERFDAFAREYGTSLVGGADYLIKRQATLNLVVPNQKTLGRLLPFHQGVWYANGRGQRTIWLALTPCFGNNSMWVVDHKNSCQISKDTLENKWSQHQFEEACLQHAAPVVIQPGQCHLFHQEILHGNVNNDTGVTRMSIDWHLLIRGGEFGNRLPGGFFRFPGDYAQSEKSDKIKYFEFIQYVGNNTEYDAQIPIPYQRLCMNDYCKQYGIQLNGTQFENAYLKWLPILESLILDRVSGIVMTSIYSLPDDNHRREYLMRLALKNNVKIHFANEYCRLETEKDLQLIQDYRAFAVKSAGPHYWE
jgi:sporadic carbohydrate cluster protein (TIGR04323 family)